MRTIAYCRARHSSVIGVDCVGTTVAACLADYGHEVVAIDGEEDILVRHSDAHLRATTDYAAVAETPPINVYTN